ncbi:MAG: succinate dehydrogenase, cytochrome b556 subunit [Gammaproteobacteria bacterium]|mgnify:FL=1|nr:succinate dehydrogenase, cytochrome b556 subunit [Gammaproteobacteria bacterium]|tara:strand:+ start:2228 stop:2608 length:381 start_codon:yes stop_codon:yes gene_type:complete
MLNTNRPTSPHLQIYKPQLTSVLSISHRITGVTLSLFSILIPASLIIIFLGQDYFNILINIMMNPLIKFLLLGVLFSTIYHLLNGIRHLFWDYGLGLSLKDSYISGYIVMFLSLSITIISFLLFIG